MNYTSKFLARRQTEMVLPWIKSLVEKEPDVAPFGESEKYLGFFTDFNCDKIKLLDSQTPFAIYLRNNGYKLSRWRKRPILQVEDIIRDTNIPIDELTGARQQRIMEFVKDRLDELNIESVLTD